MRNATVSEPDADEEPHVFLVPYGTPDDYRHDEWEDSDDGCTRELAGSMVLYFYDEVAVHRMIQALLDSLKTEGWRNAVRIPCGLDLYRDRETPPTLMKGRPTHGPKGIEARDRATWETWRKTL